MKKLFMFLAVAGLATFGTACSSSDDSNPTNTETLVVTASKLTAEVGETVTFTVKEGTADVTASADIYINGTKITGKSHTGTAVGEIKVTAKKAGANDAAAVTVKFVEKGTPLKKLVLTANPTTIELNEETVFKVTLDGADVTSTATIKVGGVAVTGGKYKGTAAGAYVAVASLAGAEDSASITIVVKAGGDPNKSFITFDGNTVDLDSSMLRIHTTADNKAKYYTTEDGTKFVIFMVQANSGDSSTANLTAIFTGGTGAAVFVSIAVVQTGASLVFPGQGAVEKVLYTDGIIDGVEFDGEKLGETITYKFNTPGKDGNVEFNATGTDYESKYKGAYTGLFIWNVEAAPAAKSLKINSFKDVNSVFKATKFSNSAKILVK